MPFSTLLERSEPLAEFNRCVRRLQSGVTGIVLVSGEAGVGKTALLATALVKWTRGCGSCVERVTTWLPPIRSGAPGGLPGTCGCRVVDNGRLEDVPSALSAHFVERPPSVLVVEDLHWADDATVDALAYLARRIEALNLLPVATYRDDEVTAGHPAPRFLATAPQRWPSSHRERARRPRGSVPIGRRCSCSARRSSTPTQWLRRCSHGCSTATPGPKP